MDGDVPDLAAAVRMDGDVPDSAAAIQMDGDVSYPAAVVQMDLTLPLLSKVLMCAYISVRNFGIAGLEKNGYTM